jgi:hypothetical protein
MNSTATMLRRLAFVGVAAVSACYGAEHDKADGSGGGNSCATVPSVPCRCLDGSNGMAECVDGIRGTCMCEGSGGNGGTSSGGNGATAGIGATGAVGGDAGAGGAFVAECTPGGFEACSCSIAEGYRICHPPGSWGECACGTIFAEGDEPQGGTAGSGAEGGADAGGAGGEAAAAAGGAAEAGAGGGCTVAEETCDGSDEDCDGVADDGYVCPDDTVHHIVQQTRGVYLQGTTSEGSCGFDALQQFWPTLTDYYYEGFDCAAERYLFRRTDNQIVYKAELEGILENTDSSGDFDTLLSTSPCAETVTAFFDYDQYGQLHYQCSDTVRRSGTLVASEITRIVAVLDDGRIIATQNAPFPLDSQFVVLDSVGLPLSTFPAADGIAGTVTPNEQAVVMGNTAYLSLLRSYDGNDEVMVFRLDESSAWQFVRRVIVDDPGSSVLASAEGTVLVRGIEPVSGTDEIITAYMADGTSFVVWDEAASSVVRAYQGDQLLPGPL